MNNRRRSKIWKISTSELIDIINNSNSLSDVLNKIGMDNNSAGNFRTLKRRLEEESIDISELEERRKQANKEHINSLASSKISLEEILIEGSTYPRNHLKNRLIKEGYLEEKCEGCGIGNTWNGKPLSLQLEHKNGINDDNRLENLCLLCPNCHSQTDTFAGRNTRKEKEKCSSCDNEISKATIGELCIECYGKTRRKVERPDIEIVKKQIEELGFVGTGRIYGVSDNAIRKWLKN